MTLLRQEDTGYPADWTPEEKLFANVQQFSDRGLGLRIGDVQLTSAKLLYIAGGNLVAWALIVAVGWMMVVVL